MSTTTDTPTLTKETLAALLNGREYMEEITREEEKTAESAGLIVIFGASDDLMEFRGVFSDEAYPGRRERPVIFDRDGLLPRWEEVKDDEEDAERYFRRKRGMKASVQALWCPEGSDGPSWAYKTDIPHATFEIVEDGEVYCRGIVIDLNDL